LTSSWNPSPIRSPWLRRGPTSWAASGKSGTFAISRSRATTRSRASSARAARRTRVRRASRIPPSWPESAPPEAAGRTPPGWAATRGGPPAAPPDVDVLLAAQRPGELRARPERLDHQSLHDRVVRVGSDRLSRLEPLFGRLHSLRDGPH